MMWRVRVTLEDRPGALARLAETCGAAEVNIVALQVFPGGTQVTDELVLGAPNEWTSEDVVELLQRSGARDAAVAPCSDAALMDQPVRYLHAARRLVADPRRFTEIATELFDADLDVVEAAEHGDADLDVIEMAVGGVLVQVRRPAPFTQSEHARAAALAALADEALSRSRRPASVVPGEATGRPKLSTRGEDLVVAHVDGHVVGRAQLHGAVGEDRSHGENSLGLSVSVDAAWRRRGIGSMLLRQAAGLGKARGAGELVLRAEAQHPAVLPMVLGTGLSGRISVQDEELVVRLPLARVSALRGPRTPGSPRAAS
ncbi:GNAT family N-acetyltransferase [Nocardioidaceae bacterium]|nr:GNAT family N-acetyltransferase [Nocardioidaceae bacterium]